MRECRYGLPCTYKSEIDLAVISQLVTEREDSIRADERKKVLDELREMIMNCRFEYSVKIALDVLIDRLLKEKSNGKTNE